MYEIRLDHPIRVFFCGIGGVSMSGIAHILKDRGFDVSGSDRARSAETDKLEKEGIRVFIGQKAENITPDLDLVVFTAAIHPDNPEYQKTMELGIPHLTRAEILGQVMKGYGCPVSISGTHGKTTTTSMISEILLEDKADPTISVGGNYKSIGGNVRVGHSPYFVAEACEYTNSFLSLHQKVGIILDIDADHLDFFKDIHDIRHSFRLFAENIPADGTLIINSDIDQVEEITDGLACRVIYYGKDPAKSDYYPMNISYDAYAHPTFTAVSRPRPLTGQAGVSGAAAAVVNGTPNSTGASQGAAGSADADQGRLAEGSVPAARQVISLHVPGEHNIYNSLAALAAADVLGVRRDISAKALSRYGGTDRRFEYKGEFNDGVTVIDDYAHHPTEIAATLTAATHMPHKRLFVIFQPHTYSRTKALFDDFAKALTIADVVILADIYAARETDTLGVSSELLAEKIKALGHNETYYFPSFEEIENFVRKNCQKGDVLITMGAGNVTNIAADLTGKKD